MQTHIISCVVLVLRLSLFLLYRSLSEKGSLCVKDAQALIERIFMYVSRRHKVNPLRNAVDQQQHGVCMEMHRNETSAIQNASRSIAQESSERTKRNEAKANEDFEQFAPFSH